MLGSALIADVKAKDKRRREWDEKIAMVRAEVDQMGGTAGVIYNIRSRNWRRLPSLGRSYSSVAAETRLAVEEEEDSIAVPEWPSTHETEGDAERPATAPLAQSPASGTVHESTEPQAESKLTHETIEKCKRLQRLVAIKLAIRMILHIHMGKSPRYINTSSDYVYHQGSLPQDANELIRHLKRVSNSLKEMNTSELRSSWRAYQTLLRGQTCSLDKDICHLVRLFRCGEVNVVQLVEQFAEKLLSSSESPTAHGYIPFLRALSRARFDELGFMVDGTMTEARLPCDRHALFTLLWQYGKNKEAPYFDKLVKKLTTYSARAQYGEQWLWRSVSGTLIPIPPSQDPQIMQILIYAALKCNQPHRAEAWSTVMSYSRTAHRWMSHVIRNFLKYYSAHRNWYKGYLWLQTALDRAEMLAIQDIRHLQRVAFAMLEFCLAHEQRRLYREILDAASKCRLGVYAADPDLTITQRSAEILGEWELCHAMAQNSQMDDLSSFEKARMFVHNLQHIRGLECEQIAGHSNSARLIDSKDQIPMRAINHVSPGHIQDRGKIGNSGYEEASSVSSVSHQDAEDGQWRELCRQQQAQLDLLGRQMKSLIFVSKSGFALAGEHERPPLNAVGNMADRKQDIVFREAGPQPLVEQVDGQGRSLTVKQPSKAWRPLSFRKRHLAAAAGNVAERSESNTFRGAAPPSSVEYGKESEGRAPTQRSEVPVQPLNSQDSSTTFSVPPPRPLSSEPIPQNTDQSLPLSTNSPQERRNESQLEMCGDIHGGSSSVLPEGRFPASPQDFSHYTPQPRTPTISEIERALNFCTCIINCLANHILDSPQIRPLYKLVSTLSFNFVVGFFLDGTFSHFIREMLTAWEREVFWDKLTVEARKRREGTNTSSEMGAEETEGSLPISRDIYTVSPFRRIVRLQESGNRLPMEKVGYGALRVQLGVAERRQAIP